MSPMPWLANYDAGVPQVFNPPPFTLPDLLAEAAQTHPTAPAVSFYGRQITYAELNQLATKFAGALLETGVEPGDRVVLVLPNVPQAVICYYGSLRAGAIVVLTNPLDQAGALVRQVADAGADSIVALSMFHPLIAQARKQVPLRRVMYTNLKEYLPGTQRTLFTLLRQEREGHRVPEAESGRSLWLARMLAAAPASPALPTINSSDPAVLLYTSGTTGEPKGVLHTHRSLVANTFQVRAWMPEAQAGRERTLCALPFSHAYGMVACMNFSVALAAEMILLPTFETGHVLSAIKRSKPTIFPGVPPMYAALMETPNVRSYGLASLRGCISGAAPLPVEVQEGFERITRCRLVEGYGLTEAGPVTHVNPLKGKRMAGSIGVPLPGTEARIVDMTTGDDVPPGALGELLVRGPQIMQGYWNRPAETAEVLDADGWLRTGDVARMTPEGFFQVIERKKEMIVAGAYNIYPRDVEEVLYEHPKVLDAAVVGVPQADGSTEMRAFVVLREGERATDTEVLAFLRERLRSHTVPQRVEFRRAIPRSAIGKVLRRMLATEEQDGQPKE
jgi:long-chain acyl-CoA synthetase